MQQVYREKLWGDNGSKFYSGEGSHHPLLVEPYIEKVIAVLTSFPEPINVCDLGCGDFNIGKQLVPYVRNYLAVDIVPELIDFNSKQFKNLKVKFSCLDITKDVWPKADCVIVRQVLQHLSNTEVAKVVSKLNEYKYVILTEHIPRGEFVPNLDIISGQGIRIKRGSGLDLLQPPFSLKVKEKKLLLSQSPVSHQGVIITYLLRMF